MKSVHNENARMAMIIRLNMIDGIGGNMGRASTCPLCMREEDTTEHVFCCEDMEDTNVTVKNLEDGERMAEVVELFMNNEERRRSMLADEIMNCEVDEMDFDNP